MHAHTARRTFHADIHGHLHTFLMRFFFFLHIALHLLDDMSGHLRKRALGYFFLISVSLVLVVSSLFPKYFFKINVV